MILVTDQAPVASAYAKGTRGVGIGDIVEFIPDQLTIKRVDALVEIKSIAGYCRDGVVAAIDPEETDRQVLALESAVVGDQELEDRDFVRTIIAGAEAKRVIAAVIGVCQCDNTNQAARARSAAISDRSIAIGEVFPSAGVK